MPLDENMHGLLERLEPAASAEANRLPAEIREQLKSIADPYRNERGRFGVFVGATGTGKTLAARILGNRLGREAYRIDLAAAVSKYIGETEKNLATLMETDAAREAVLLFEEADSLFGRRSGADAANDRYANQETSYLLQRIESFEGLAVFASNTRDNLDETVLEQAAWIVEFTRPLPARQPPWWQRVLRWPGVFGSG